MKQVFLYLLIIIVLIAGTFLIYTNYVPSGAPKTQPNVVLILGDDIGYSDISPYGSEIQTPNLDRLANEGIRFSNFYNMSKCQSSRSSLFTGQYEGGLSSVNFASFLKREGYRVYHVGKEHWMKWAPEHVKAQHVFNKSLTFEAMNEFFEPPGGTFHKPFILNGDTVKIHELDYEKQPFFKTDALTDYALRWMDESVQSNEPFFLFLGYGASHYPLQARPEDIDRYRGKYKKGWDVVRQERYARLQEKGLISQNTVLSPPTSNINKFRGISHDIDKARQDKIPLYRPWDTLSPEEQDEMDLEMAVFAAMTDRMDQNIGRVLDYLDAKGIAENTIVIFLSDNGSCPYDSNRDFDYPPGVAEGFRTLSAAWANVGNTPFKYFKQYGHEGGAHTHCIMRWPEEIQAGRITQQTGHIVDIAPTLMDATRTKFPKKLEFIECQPFQGKSLLPVLKGGTREEPEFFLSGWEKNFRMFRMKEWKIVKLNNEDWELYNLLEDPTELHNRAAEFPEKVKEMEAVYQNSHKELRHQAGR